MSSDSPPPSEMCEGNHLGNKRATDGTESRRTQTSSSPDIEPNPEPRRAPPSSRRGLRNRRSQVRILSGASHGRTANRTTVGNGGYSGHAAAWEQNQRIEPSCVGGPSRNYRADRRPEGICGRHNARDCRAALESGDSLRLRRAKLASRTSCALLLSRGRRRQLTVYASAASRPKRQFAN
jgi:hypothetical protein